MINIFSPNVLVNHTVERILRRDGQNKTMAQVELTSQNLEKKATRKDRELANHSND